MTTIRSTIRHARLRVAWWWWFRVAPWWHRLSDAVTGPWRYGARQALLERAFLDLYAKVREIEDSLDDVEASVMESIGDVRRDLADLEHPFAEVVPAKVYYPLHGGL